MGRGDEQLRTAIWQRALAVVAIVMVLWFVVYPFGTVALEMVARADVHLLGQRLGETLQLVMRSGIQAGLSTLCTLVVSVPIARLLARFNFVGRAAMVAVVTVPFVIPTVVTALAFRATFPAMHQGLIAVIAGHLLVNVAVYVNLVMPRWRTIDEQLLVQARSLGATPWQVLRNLELPLLRHELARASGLVFVFCFTSLGLATLLGDGSTRTLESQMLRQISMQLDFTGASVNFAVQCALVALVLWLTNRIRRVSAIPTMDATRLPSMSLRNRTIAYFVALAMLLPYASILRIADWQALRQLPRGLQQLGNPLTVARYSLLVAGLTAATAVVVAAVFALSRPRRIAALGYVPLALSSVGVGLALLLTFLRAPWHWSQGTALVVVGEVIIGLPVWLGVLQPLLAAVSPSMVVAAQALGAGPTRSWLTAYGRTVVRGSWQVAGLAAVMALGELGAATVLTSYDRPTLTVEMFRLLQRPGGSALGIAAAIGTLLLVGTVGVFAAAYRAAGLREVMR